MDVGFDRASVHEGFAEAGETCVGVDVEPEKLGEFGDADGFELGDLHGFCYSTS